MISISHHIVTGRLRDSIGSYFLSVSITQSLSVSFCDLCFRFSQGYWTSTVLKIPSIRFVGTLLSCFVWLMQQITKVLVGFNIDDTREMSLFCVIISKPPRTTESVRPRIMEAEIDSYDWWIWWWWRQLNPGRPRRNNKCLCYWSGVHEKRVKSRLLLCLVVTVGDEPVKHP